MLKESSMKKCPVCGKMFIATVDWVYKKETKNGIKFYCRYNCYRATYKDYKFLNRPTGKHNY